MNYKNEMMNEDMAYVTVNKKEVEEMVKILACI
jgi:hypothetical protein